MPTIDWQLTVTLIVARRTARLNFVLRSDQPEGGDFDVELVTSPAVTLAPLRSPPVQSWQKLGLSESDRFPSAFVPVHAIAP